MPRTSGSQRPAVREPPRPYGPGSRSNRERIRCRRRRRTRFRTTAPPTALDTTNPARTDGLAGFRTGFDALRAGSSDLAWPSAIGLGVGADRFDRRWTAEPRRGRRQLLARRAGHPRPWRKTRHVAGVGRSPPTCLPESAQADRRARPLARRAARIARPARVRMRSRKPWVFERRRLFGWKVRLLTSGTPSSSCSPHVATMCQLNWVNPGPALRHRDPDATRPSHRATWVTSGVGICHDRQLAERPATSRHQLYQRG